MDESAETDTRPSAAKFAPGAVGVTAPCNAGRSVFSTEVIVELGFADRETVAKAIEATRGTVETPEGYLLESGAIDERQLSLALAERSGLDHVDLDRFEVDPGAVAMIEDSTAARYTALPIAFATDGALLVAIEDPYNMPGISAIQAMTGSEVRPVVAAGTQIRRLIAQLPEGAPQRPPEPPPPPSRPEQGAAEADSPPEQPEPPVAVPTENVEAEPAGDLSMPLATLQEKMREVADLVDAVEWRWRRRAERERKLDERLSEAEERLAAIEERESRTNVVGELANAAREKLAELQGVIEDGRS